MRADRRETLWARIERNGPKLALYLGAFVVVWAAAAEVVVVLPAAIAVWWFYLTRDAYAPFGAIMLWGGVVFLVLGVLVAAAGALRSERSILAQLGAARVPTGELPDTKRVLHDMSLAVGLKYPPPLYVLDSCALNAFVIGRRPERAAVGVTTGLLKALTPDEQRAVFANLLTRLAEGDVLVGTIVSSLMSPTWMWRRYDLERDDDPEAVAAMLSGDGPVAGAANATSRDLGIAFVFFFWILAIFVTEFLYYGHMRQQILTAEAADAKGMLLLKEPRAMLSALRKVLPADNSVPRAGAGLAPLFFAWTGDAYLDDRDPEVRRVARMREVLGAEGFDEASGIDPVTAECLEPPAPRIVG